ncbi:MAG: class I SAM-dependent methyltransferase [Dehalococcoidia bacterium]|jgi:SAM-dependent methyltransferase
MHWDNEYRQQKHIWGKGPSELAVFAVDYLKQHPPAAEAPRIIDLGCGYGRDVFYIAQNIRCSITGIDKSPEAIRMVWDGRPEKSQSDIRFEHRDFLELPTENKYDIVYTSNIYHLLRLDERARFREIIKSILEPQGLLFMSVMSLRDPQHYGKGDPVANETNSFVDKVYLHLCTEEELREDFGFLTVRELQENPYDEPRSNGETHHHMIWLLAGQKSS